jgi:hypothetical protein
MNRIRVLYNIYRDKDYRVPLKLDGRKETFDMVKRSYLQTIMHRIRFYDAWI